MPDPAPASDSFAPIFLSYASEDAVAARRIADALGHAGLVVWFDQSELRGGDAWDQRIRRQIKECALFLPVISAHTQARAEGYFRLEWHLAEQRSFLMAQSKAFIVPVVVDDTPETLALVPDRFRERQWTRFASGQVPSDFAARMAQLLGTAPAPRAGMQVLPVVPPAPANERSVAILAFSNLSRDEENEYFAEGVSDELLAVLQKIPGLRVAARTSAFSFKGKHVPAREIGALLDVSHLVEGGVQKLGNRVKVAARLTSAASGVVKWTGSYTRELTDAFALQEELALAIVGELRGQLAGDEASLVQQANRGGTRVPAAYESYLLGKHFYEQFSETTIAQAVEHLRRATELDPEFALAWVALSNAQSWRCGYLVLSRHEFDSILADGQQAVERALSLQPDLGAAVATLGRYQLAFDFDLAAAAASRRRAEQLAPNDPDVMNLCVWLSFTEPEALGTIELCRRVLARDPINPRPHLYLSGALAECGRFDEARQVAARFRELTRNTILADVAIARVYVAEGRYAEAERSLEPAATGWTVEWLRALIHHALGRTAEAAAALQTFERDHGATAAVQVAMIHAFRGEADLAFRWLEQSRQNRDPGLFQMYRSDCYRNLHRDPRWAAFWRRLGLLVAN